MTIISKQLHDELENVHQRSNQANLIWEVLRDVLLARLFTDRPCSIKDVPEEFYEALPRFLPEDFPPDLELNPPTSVPEIIPLPSVTKPDDPLKAVRFSDIVKANPPKTPKPPQIPRSPPKKERPPIPALMDLKISPPPGWYPNPLATHSGSSHSPPPKSAFNPPKAPRPLIVRRPTPHRTPEASKHRARQSSPLNRPATSPDSPGYSWFTPEDIEIAKYLGLDKTDFAAM